MRDLETTEPPCAACGWIIDDDADEDGNDVLCGKPATRGTAATGPLCDEHGEEHERESEGR